LVGYLNDLMQAQFGAKAIRYSLLVGPICAMLAGLIIWTSAKSLDTDTRRALEAE